MSEQDHTAVKLEAFLDVLGDLIGEALAAGVSPVGLRRTLLGRAVLEFKAHPSDGIIAIDQFRKALERWQAASSSPAAE